MSIKYFIALSPFSRSYTLYFLFSVLSLNHGGVDLDIPFRAEPSIINYNSYFNLKLRVSSLTIEELPFECYNLGPTRHHMYLITLLIYCVLCHL